MGTACGENGQSGGCVVGAHRKVELRVVSVLVVPAMTSATGLA